MTEILALCFCVALLSFGACTAEQDAAHLSPGGPVLWWDGEAPLDGNAIRVVALSRSATLIVRQLRFVPMLRERYAGVHVTLVLPTSMPFLLDLCFESIHELGVDVLKSGDGAGVNGGLVCAPIEPEEGTVHYGKVPRDVQPVPHYRRTYYVSLSELSEIFEEIPMPPPYLACPHIQLMKVQPPHFAAAPLSLMLVVLHASLEAMSAQDKRFIAMLQNLPIPNVWLVAVDLFPIITALSELHKNPKAVVVASLCDPTAEVNERMLLLAHIAGAMGRTVWLSLCKEETDTNDIETIPDVGSGVIGSRTASMNHATKIRATLETFDDWFPKQRTFRDYAALVEAFAHRDATLAAMHGGVDRTLLVNGTAHNLIDSKHGFFLYPHGDMFIGQSLEKYGEWSELEVAFFAKVIKPGDWVLDIGANVGAFTLPFAKLVADHGQVVAFEPQRVLFQALNANLALNSIRCVVTHCAGVSNVMSSFRAPSIMYEGRNNYGAVSLSMMDEFSAQILEQEGVDSRVSQSIVEKVPIVTIDSLNLSRCNFIKVDVEGMELEVLQGATDTIHRFQPFLHVENDRTAQSKALLAYAMHTLGYRLFWHITNGYNSHNVFRNPQDIFTNNGATFISVNVFGVHASRVAELCPRAEGKKTPPPCVLDDLMEVTSICEVWQDASNGRKTQCPLPSS